MVTPGVFTDGYKAQMGAADPTQYFTSENTGYNVYIDAGGEARLSVPYTVTVPGSTGGSVAVAPVRSDSKYGEGETVTLTVDPEAGYVLTGLTVAYTDGEGAPQTLTPTQDGTNAAKYTFTMPPADATVTATFSQWKWLQNELAKDDNTITLMRDITCEDQAFGPLNVPQGVTVTLDLNGYVIDRGLGNGEAIDSGSVITVNGTLIVEDGKATAEHAPAIAYADPTDPTRTVTVYGGVITGGNNTGNGGGVCVDGGSFTMNGGTICGNTANFGGGVNVAENGAFNVSGGAVSGNSAAYGGGVNVAGNGAFTMTGGTICGNTGGQRRRRERGRRRRVHPVRRRGQRQHGFDRGRRRERRGRRHVQRVRQARGQRQRADGRHGQQRATVLL